VRVDISLMGKIRGRLQSHGEDLVREDSPYQDVANHPIAHTCDALCAFHSHINVDERGAFKKHQQLLPPVQCRPKCHDQWKLAFFLNKLTGSIFNGKVSKVSKMFF
jgi:hypothetical protein